MNSLLTSLKPKQRSGSKARCHMLTSGTRDVVAKRLSGLIAPWGIVSPDDHWMPNGFEEVAEAQLHNAPRLCRNEVIGGTLKSWWLAVAGSNTTTPNWDIASTCRVGDKPGLLLVEAKAHDAELRNEEKGKAIGSQASQHSQRNHISIGGCIEEAGLELTAATGLPWCLSRDQRYQMANRFAWSWKLKSMGIPVVLVYLGFTGCEEMRRPKQFPFSNHEDWNRLVLEHSSGMIPSTVWDQCWSVGGHHLIPIIRTTTLALDQA